METQQYTVKAMGRGLYTVLTPRGFDTYYTTSYRADAVAYAKKMNKRLAQQQQTKES